MISADCFILCTPIILPYIRISQEIQECLGILAARCASCNCMTYFSCAPLQSCRRLYLLHFSMLNYWLSSLFPIQYLYGVCTFFVYSNHIYHRTVRYSKINIGKLIISYRQLHDRKDLGYISCEAFVDFDWANFSVICRV